MPPTSPVIGDSLLTRLGRVTCSVERTFWFVGHGRVDFEAIADFVDALMARYPRLSMAFTAPQSETRDWLRRRWPRAIVVSPPLPLRLAADRYLDNLNVRGLAIVGGLGRGDRALLRAANARATPAVVVERDGGTAATATSLGAVPEQVHHHFAVRAASRDALLEAGIDGTGITLLSTTGEERNTAILSVVAELLAQDLKLLRSKQRPLRRRLERLALRCMDNPRLRRLLSFKAERYDGIEDLRRALGNPQTILCLGNGPSSEDPEIAEVAHDALFRVNFLWKKRGFLTEPDMVFTGSKETLKTVRGPIFGLQSIRSEARLLVTRILHPAFGRMRYAAIERFGLFISESHLHGVRPTNGAAMLAVAVALQPARLVISGIDLFSHPAGTYPGDTTTPNAYTPGHDANSELALLLEALSRYKGELVILSEALRARWEEYRQGAVAAGKAPDSAASEGPAASGRGDLRLA